MTQHQPAHADDVPLSGGRMTSGIVRRGDRLPPYARTDLALCGAAELLRKLHVAAAGF